LLEGRKCGGRIGNLTVRPCWEPDMPEACIVLCDALAVEARAHLQKIHAFSASQARDHRDVVVRFGRQPHRNAVLGRTSTEEKLAYLAAGELVHRRSFQA
jgi:Bacterial protein of unknown function (DUF924)